MPLWKNSGERGLCQSGIGNYWRELIRFDVSAAAGFVVGAGGSDLVAVSLGEEATFLVIDVVGGDGLIGFEGLPVVAQGNGDRAVEAIALNQPVEDFEAFELGEVGGWGEVGIEAGVALLDGLEVGFARVAAHDQLGLCHRFGHLRPLMDSFPELLSSKILFYKGYGVLGTQLAWSKWPKR